MPTDLVVQLTSRPCKHDKLERGNGKFGNGLWMLEQRKYARFRVALVAVARKPKYGRIENP